MKRKIHTFLNVLLMGTSLVLWTACSGLLSPEKAKENQKQGNNSAYGRIVFGAADSRTVVPGFGSSFDSCSVTLTCKSGGHLPISRDFAAGSNTVSIEQVASGTWDIAVSAKKGGTVVASGTLKNQEITAGQTLSLPAVSLLFAKGGGTGTLALKVRIPEASGIDYLEAKLDGGEAFFPTVSAPVSGFREVLIEKKRYLCRAAQPVSGF